MSEKSEKAFALFNAAIGESEGTGDWFEVIQADIDTFADVTHDHQFIHVDPEACTTMSPWGVPIAHGF
ncbi:MAG: MaoC/PaaZ C-terminal domain-containing protein, partial [Actinomycetes bacterium]